MKDLYFLSDLHLGLGPAAAERRKRTLLLDLLSEAKLKAEHLFLVGDLFDFWFEYRHVVPRGHHAILTALESLVDTGIPVTYFAGNHDFAIGPSIEQDLGVRIVRDGLVHQTGNRNFYIHHGDGLAVKDAGYRILKAVLRNRMAQGMFRLLHPDLGFAVARLTSHSSRKYTETKEFGSEDGMRREAMRRIEAGADYVVMGHRHKASLEKLGSGVYVNLGDWLSSFTYAVFRNDCMTVLTRRNGIEETVFSE